MLTYNDFYKIFTEKFKDLDLNNLNVYINFVIENNNKFVGYREKHHLLPRSLFPEFASTKANLFKLSASNHLEAHFLLYKLLPNKAPVIYSINMMVNRGQIDPNFDLNSVEQLLEKYKAEYEEYRIKVAQLISENNTGKERTEEQKKHMSEVRLGTVGVRDKDGNCFRVKTDDPRFETGEIINARVGYKHSEATLAKFRAARIKYKGMKPYNNGKEVKYLPGPEGEFCNPGYLKETNIKKALNSGKDFIYKDGVQRRLKAGEEVPEGWTRGRLKKGGFDGSAHINNRWFDLKTKEIIDKDPGDATRYKRYSKDFKTKDYPVFDGRLFTNVEDLLKYIKEKTDFNIPIVYNSVPILKGLCIGDLSLISSSLRNRAENFLVTNNVKRLNQKFDIKFMNVYDVDYNKVKFYEFSTAKKWRR